MLVRIPSSESAPPSPLKLTSSKSRRESALKVFRDEWERRPRRGWLKKHEKADREQAKASEQAEPAERAASEEEDHDSDI